VKRITARQRMLLVVAAVAAAGWGLDTLLRTKPKPAKAGVAAAVSTVPQAVDWDAVERLVTQLTGSQYDSVAGQVATLRRDAFVPTPLIRAAVAPPPPPAPAPPEPVVVEAEAPSEPVEADFAVRHVLSGVTLGSHPLAVVNSRVLRLSDTLDGHTLIAIQRDAVTFRCQMTASEVVLRLRHESVPGDSTP
jgi:hypothetical protein